MKCPTCHRLCKPLLTSFACDWCDGYVDFVADCGFIVYIPKDIAAGSLTFVFRDRSGAERWRASKDLQDYPICEVRAPCKFRWTKNSGATDEVELADRVFEIYPNHRFPYAENRAYLTVNCQP